jgi:ABC-type iron transport system FetAB permease component
MTGSDSVATAAKVAAAGWTPEVVLQLSSWILWLGALALILSAVLMFRQRTSSHVIRVFGIIIIVTLSTLLVVVGYSNEQLTPVIGLFGAIAGYLLGKETSETDTRPPSTPVPPDT